MVLELLRQSVLLDVGRRGEDRHVDLADARGDQLVRGRAEEADGEIGLAGGEVEHLIAGDHLDDDVGMGAAQHAEPRHQPVGGDALGGGDADDAGHFAVEAGQVPLDRRGVGHHRFGLDQHAAGGRGHFHAVAVAVEQLGAQPPLERLDAPADGGLLGIQLGGGGAEAAGLCNREEETNVIPVAENVRHLVLARRSRDHRNNRYNKGCCAQSLLDGSLVVHPTPLSMKCRFLSYCRGLGGFFGTARDPAAPI